MSGRENEGRPVTPGRLAIWGGQVIGAGVLVAGVFVIVSLIVASSSKPDWLVLIAWVLWIVGALLLLAAGIAKVIAIGVRSGQQ